MTETDLASLEALAAAAQPGPWSSHVEGRDHQSGSSFIMTGSGAGRGDDFELSGATVEDLDFIAASRQAIPMLIAEIRSLRRQIEAMKS
ncbi:hypothetical protein [Roseateles sp. L2-2]|uniref:hypothetical protein n=1 Tax=Roseateles TaxID=93681 RepID=UPI003D364C35